MLLIRKLSSEGIISKEDVTFFLENGDIESLKS